MLVFWFFDRVAHVDIFNDFDFYSEKNPFCLWGAAWGVVSRASDDWLDIHRRGPNGMGLRFRFKLILYSIVAAIGAWWFYFKLGFNYVYVPLPAICIWVGCSCRFLLLWYCHKLFRQPDGWFRRASRGSLMIAFFAFGLIAFLQGKHDLATFIGVICGSLLAFFMV